MNEKQVGQSKRRNIHVYTLRKKKEKKITYYQAITRKRFRGRKTFFCCFSKHKYYLRGGRKKKRNEENFCEKQLHRKKNTKIKGSLKKTFISLWDWFFFISWWVGVVVGNRAGVPQSHYVHIASKKKKYPFFSPLLLFFPFSCRINHCPDPRIG